IKLAAEGSGGRYLVPSNGLIGTTWTGGQGFDDSGWSNGQSALGFDTGSGGYDTHIFTDVSNVLFGINNSIYLRILFDRDSALDIESLRLNMLYDDGFTAWINGQPVAADRSPASPIWNSPAVSAHPDASAVVWQSFALTNGLESLVDEDNILAIQGLNVSPDDPEPDFLLVPELEAITRVQGYLTAPTPGSNNTAGALLGEVDVNPIRGFFDQPVYVALTSDVPDAVIYYTTDFSEPSTNSLPYTGLISISNSTVIRAAAFKPGYQASPIATHSYIFHENVLQQPDNPPGFPSTWGAANAEYLMRDTVLNNYTGADITNYLRFLPTISIVTEMDHLFDDATGIYDNPTQRGFAWERAASVEYLSTNGVSGFG
ncbi:MAG: chitobiase/beta-hexosaminidase C-terminal domain-containing protein, partial [Verrucomicrobiota bacterium]